MGAVVYALESLTVTLYGIRLQGEVFVKWMAKTGGGSQFDFPSIKFVSLGVKALPLVRTRSQTDHRTQLLDFAVSFSLPGSSVEPVEPEPSCKFSAQKEKAGCCFVRKIF